MGVLFFGGLVFGHEDVCGDSRACRCELCVGAHHACENVRAGGFSLLRGECAVAGKSLCLFKSCSHVMECCLVLWVIECMGICGVVFMHFLLWKCSVCTSVKTL